MPATTRQEQQTEGKQADILGVILAGGNATRLGQALKSGILVRGQSLLERVESAIRDDCTHILLSVGKHQKNQFHSAPNFIALSDSGNGPAAALIEMAAFALSELPQTQFLLTVAVDTPFFPSDFAARARQILTPQLDVVVATFGDQVYPTNALWRLSSFSPKTHERRNPSHRALFSLLDRREWARLDYSSLQSDNPFVNINTPADLIACNRQAELEASS